jgi:gamma-glutamyltranspeptidase/glutathione hydrolase
VLLQSLNLLENFDLLRMGYNTADYIHTVVECMKLAYADREFYYGDPDFVDVPLKRLLSKEYAAERIELVDPRQASLLLRPGGYPEVQASSIADVSLEADGSSSHPEGDTTKLEVIDSRGNMVSATPSGGWLHSSPVVPEAGFPLGTRGQMFSLQRSHPNRLEPGKRPRATLTPSLALRNGRPYMVFGSPGGDCQDQWALQFFLNVELFGMSLQDAVEAPTFWTTHFPDSFYPRKAEPGSLVAEGRIPDSVLAELEERRHRVRKVGDWDGGNTLAAALDPETGIRCAAASPRLEPAYAAGW